MLKQFDSEIIKNFNAHKCKAPLFMPVKQYSASFRADGA